MAHRPSGHKHSFSAPPSLRDLKKNLLKLTPPSSSMTPSYARLAPTSPAICIFPTTVPVDECQRAYQFIAQTLESNKIQGAYGIPIGFKEPDGRISPAIRFGFPQGTVPVVARDNTRFKVYIMEDKVLSGLGRWANKEVQDPGRLGQVEISLGQEGDLDEAGSFCAFLEASNGKCFGTTASHVVPMATRGSRLVSPASQETTARLSHILSYTTMGPDEAGKKVNPRKEQEALNLLARYTSQPSTHEDAVHVLQNKEQKRLALSGRFVGELVGKTFSLKNVLNPHNNRLGPNRFIIPMGHLQYLTRVDLAVFACPPHLQTLNTAEDDTAVNGCRLVQPRDNVKKIGRSTGPTVGVVLNTALLHYFEDTTTAEFVVTPGEFIGNGDEVSSELPFALPGDSGSLVTCTNDKYRNDAIGLVHALTRRGELVAFTPMWCVLEEAEKLVGSGSLIVKGTFVHTRLQLVNQTLLMTTYSG